MLLVSIFCPWAASLIVGGSWWIVVSLSLAFFFFSSRRRHTRFDCDWSSDVCSSDLRSAARTLGGVRLPCGPPSLMHIGTRLRCYEPRDTMLCGSPMPRGDPIARPAEWDANAVGFFRSW